MPRWQAIVLALCLGEPANLVETVSNQTPDSVSFQKNEWFNLNSVTKLRRRGEKKQAN